MPTVEENLLSDLLQRSTADLHARREITSRIVAHQRRTHRRVVAGTALGGAAVLAAAGVAVLSPTPARPHAPEHAAAPATSGKTLLYRLASASAAAPQRQGRYVVLTETDTETGYAGESRRTTVDDAVTGASTTYQHAYPLAGIAPSDSYASEPPVLTEGPDPTLTEASYAALPTEPTVLRASLLEMAQQQEAEAASQAAAQSKVKPGLSPVPQPALTDDDLVYQEADEMLWSPLVSPTLRSALYRVLASAPGVTVTDDATDPNGRPAIAMQRTFTGVPETDITYEDPATGAVLAQVWSENGGAVTAVYQPITSTDVIPTDPYPS
jgi:hypothetical protein